MIPVVIGCGLLYGLEHVKANEGPLLLGYYLLALVYSANPLIVAWIVGVYFSDLTVPPTDVPISPSQHRGCNKGSFLAFRIVPSKLTILLVKPTESSNACNVQHWLQCRQHRR